MVLIGAVLQSLQRQEQSRAEQSRADHGWVLTVSFGILQSCSLPSSVMLLLLVVVVVVVVVVVAGSLKKSFICWTKCKHILPFSHFEN